MLKINIVLLPFADLRSGLCEQPKEFGQVLRRHSFQELVSRYEHLVTAEDSRIVIPLDMHRRHTSTHVGTIHHIVMQQREVMEHLDSLSERQCVSFVAAHKTTPGQHELHPQTLTARRQSISYRRIQTLRLTAPVQCGYGGVTIKHSGSQ